MQNNFQKLDVFRVVERVIFFCLLMAISCYPRVAIILKLCQVIDWPWYLVLLPYEIELGIVVLLLVASFINSIYYFIYHKIKKR